MTKIDAKWCSENTPKKHPAKTRQKNTKNLIFGTRGIPMVVQGPREGLAMATNVAAQVPRNITIAVLWVQLWVMTNVH